MYVLYALIYGMLVSIAFLPTVPYFSLFFIISYMMLAQSAQSYGKFGIDLLKYLLASYDWPGWEECGTSVGYVDNPE